MHECEMCETRVIQTFGVLDPLNRPMRVCVDCIGWFDGVEDIGPVAVPSAV